VVLVRILALILVSVGCQKNSDSATSVSPEQPATTTESAAGSKIYAEREAFPACVEELDGASAFAKKEHAFYVCVDGEWLTSTAVSNSKPEAGPSDKLALDCADATTEVPETAGLSGQLIISIPDNVEPCSVEGYVVGKKDEIKLQTSKDGQYYFDNVPPGDHDVIVTAGTLAITTALALDDSGPDRGIRLNRLSSISGLVNQVGEIALPKLGQISGQAHLNAAGVTDHAGVTVYIPGTSYIAISDAAGNFSIGDVPAGIHSVYFEKDGYARGQIESVAVNGESTTTLDKLNLYLDSGASGSFSVVNGFTSGYYTVVPNLNAELLVAPSSNAVLMLIEREGVEGRWTPVKTNYLYQLDLQKYLSVLSSSSVLTNPIMLTMRAKFANANGLESDTITKSLKFDLFSDGTQEFRPQANVNISTSPSLKINISNIQIPIQAEEMAIRHTTPNAYNSNDPAFGPKTQTSSINLQDTIANCGKHKVDIFFRGYSGKIRTTDQLPNAGGFASLEGDRTCHFSPSNSNAPSIPSNSNFDMRNGSFSAVAVGTKVLVVGWDDYDALTVSIYDSAANSWSIGSTTGGRYPVGRRDNFQLYAVGNYAFMFGGVNPSNSSEMSDYYVYDINQNQWLPAPGVEPLSSELGVSSSRRGIAIADGKVNLISSIQTSNGNPMTYEMHHRAYDPASNSWTVLQVIGTETFSDSGGTWSSNYADDSKLRPSRNFGILGVGDEILIVGGILEGASSAHGLVYRYSPASNSILQMASLPSGKTLDLTMGGSHAYFARFYGSSAINGTGYIALRGSNVVLKFVAGTEYVWQALTLGENIELGSVSSNDFAINADGIMSVTSSGDLKILSWTGQTASARFASDTFWGTASPLAAAEIPGIGLFVFGTKIYQSVQTNSSKNSAVIKLDFADQF
jgi:hypothetical protein